jgi:hypothetical protein
MGENPIMKGLVLTASNAEDSVTPCVNVRDLMRKNVKCSHTHVSLPSECSELHQVLLPDFS